jgi:hypothetical protein
MFWILIIIFILDDLGRLVLLILPLSVCCLLATPALSAVRDNRPSLNFLSMFLFGDLQFFCCQPFEEDPLVLEAITNLGQHRNTVCEL